MAGAASPTALAFQASFPSSGKPATCRRNGAALGLPWKTPQPPGFPSLRDTQATVAKLPAAAGAPPASDAAELKAQLKEALYGTERGVRASSETQAEVAELVTRLEARNPTVAPADALATLDGKWILVFALHHMDRIWKRHAETWYSSFSQLLPLLRFESKLPELVKVEEISQTIDSKNFTIQNCIKFSGPLATGSVSTNAKFEVRSPRRVQIKFDEDIIATPQLTDSVVLPAKFELLGHNIDLALLKAAFSPIEIAASSIANTIFGQTSLNIPLRTSNTESWLLTTYLDTELRISRGDGGGIFVLFKEGSPLLKLGSTYLNVESYVK